MRKIFLLIPVLLISLVTKAVSPGTKALYNAYNSADAGSTIVLEAGTYEETERIQFTKSMTIMAADGAEVIVKTYKDNPLTLGAEVKFIGIKFDGSEMGTREYFIRAYDATAGNELHFENCELYNFPTTTYLINAASDSRTLDSVIITNCYFHNNGNDAIYMGTGTAAAVCKGVIVKNSTFANSSASHSIIEVRNQGELADDVELTVDHCTFYNNTFGDGDYANIRAYKLEKSHITNCIFAHPTAYAKYAAYSYGGTLTNCLSYNLESGYRNWTPCPTLTDNVTADPLFNDIANNRYTYAGDYTTMSISPARGAATDGSDLGDPRWYSAEVLPSTDFATPYAFIGAKAVVSNNMELDGSNYIASTASGGTAYWKIHAERACLVQVTLNLLADYGGVGHNYQVEIFDADNNTLGALNEGGWHSDGDDKVLSGNIQIPEEGNYKIVLTNNESGSTTTIKGITLSYLGGAIQNIPCTMLPVDALRSSRAYIDVNDEFRFTNDDEDGHVTEEWAKWRMHAAKGGYYKFATSVNSDNGHSYIVTVYNADETVEKGSVTQPGTDIWGAPKTFSTDNIFLEEGDYIIKVQNTTTNSHGRIVNIVATYAGGAVIDIPAALPLGDAILSEYARLNQTGTVDTLCFAREGHESDAADATYSVDGSQFVKWNINVAKAGKYIFTANTYCKQGHNYRIMVLNEDENSTIYTTQEAADDTYSWASQGSDLLVSTDPIDLAAGNYVLKMQAKAYGRVMSVVATYAGGAVIDIPATLPLEDAIFSEYARLDQTGTVDTLCFAREGHESDAADATYSVDGSQFVKWNINVAKAGKYIFTANTYCKQGHNYRIMVLNEDESSTIYTKQEAASDTYSWANEGADLLVSTDPVDLAAGNYVLKIQAKKYGRVMSVVAEYLGGAVTELPGQLLGEDAVLEATKLYRESNGDIHYNDNGTPTNEYVWWNVHAAAAGELIVTLNLDPDNGSGHNYRVELYDGSTLQGYTEQGADSWKKGDNELTDHLSIPAAGDYTIRLINQTANSSNIIKAITFTAAPVLSNVTIDDNATDNSAWVANVGGAAVNVELTRTFVGGMYNTISLPFAVSSEKVVAAFGAGVELMEMTDATLDGTVLDFVFTPTTSIYQGTPYLIKPTADVANPQFNGVEFVLDNAAGSASGGTNADFIGTFVKTTILADVNNLYLQSGNVLKFSDNDVTIKGTRAYFHVDVPSGILPVVRPRIVMNGQVITDIELINGEPVVNGKFIENGQLIIIRDGVRYNALGVRVK